MAELKDRYGGALFELSMEEGLPKEHLEQAVFVKSVLQSQQCEEFLVHPHISDEDKYKFLQDLFADKISDILMGFLRLAVFKSRESLIVPAISEYIDMTERHSGKVVARVCSATKLSKKQVDSLSVLLSKKLNKQVEIETQVDSSLIGGFYIYVDGRLIDRTVRTQLKNMKECIERGDIQ